MALVHVAHVILNGPKLPMIYGHCDLKYRNLVVSQAFPITFQLGLNEAPTIDRAEAYLMRCPATN